MHVVSERGLAGTTLRHVADHAGVSVGLVQRYFATKADLLHFGFDHVYRRTHERIAAVPLDPPVRTILVGIAEAILPLDPERRRESRVWLAFVHASLSDAQLARTHQQSATELLEGLQAALAGAQRAGELRAGLDLDAEAATLMALLDGLTLSGIAMEDRYPAEVLRELVHDHLDSLVREPAP